MAGRGAARAEALRRCDRLRAMATSGPEPSVAPTCSSCAAWPGSSATTSRARSKTTRWPWHCSPGSRILHGRRGWAYLVSSSPQLARRDFEEALRLDPSSSDAYSGRGAALVLLGEHGQAVSDAEESLRHGEPQSRMLYNAARIYAQTAADFAARAGRRGRLALDPVVRYQERALELLGQAMERTPAEQQAPFWSEVILRDNALAAIRRLNGFTRLAAKYCATDSLTPAWPRGSAAVVLCRVWAQTGIDQNQTVADDDFRRPTWIEEDRDAKFSHHPLDQKKYHEGQTPQDSSWAVAPGGALGGPHSDVRRFRGHLWCSERSYPRRVSSLESSAGLQASIPPR